LIGWLLAPLQDFIESAQEKWQQMTAEQRLPFERLAAADAERYRREVTYTSIPISTQL